MRNAINNTTNVTAVAIVNRSVATALVGVDASRMDSPRHLRLYHAAPAPHRWAHFVAARKQQAGKQKPAMGLPGGDLSRLERATRCRRPRLSSCLGRS
jgi:hypothetical protein